MSYNNYKNPDDVHAREITLGLLYFLNHKIFFRNVINSYTNDIIDVPFTYSLTGDERFLQDDYMRARNCIHTSMLDGNYDRLPRGHINISSYEIDRDNLTNRFVRGVHFKNIDGKIKAYNSFINMIPMKLEYECKIQVDTTLDMYKISQQLIEVFYASHTFNCTYKGYRIPCTVAFPDTYTGEKTLEYSGGDIESPSITFVLTIETFIPVENKETEFANNNRITTFIDNYNVDSGTISESDTASITPDLSIEGKRFYYPQTIPIQWKSDMKSTYVDISYSEDGTNWNYIATHLIDNGIYNWKFPIINNNINTNINFTSNNNLANGAELLPIIDANGELEEIIILNEGNGYENTDTISIDDSNIGYVPAEVQLYVSNGKITGYNIVSPGSNYTPTKYKTVSIKIENSIYPSINSLINNVTIM